MSHSEILSRLHSEGKIHPPRWLPSNTHYLCVMGSTAYGCDSSESSDMDIYGWCIPPVGIVFPHTEGHIPGFGRQRKNFTVWQEHHVKTARDNQEYDFSVYNVVHYVNLVMENNPNMIDSLFVPRRCILKSTQTSEILREHRREFLHKGSFHKLKGYAYSQLHKIRTKTPQEGSKRYDNFTKFGFDCKFGYHVVRLVLQCEQILTEKDLDLERNREIFKSIRRGEWSEEKIIEFFEKKEKYLEELYQKSDLPHQPDEEKIKRILLHILEEHYGSIDGFHKDSEKDVEKKCLREIQSVLGRYGFL